MNIQDDKFVQTLCPAEKQAFLVWIAQLLSEFYRFKETTISFQSIDDVAMIDFYDCFMNGDTTQEAIAELLS
jgi:hypothetical protein